MKANTITLFVALLAGFFGGLSSQYLFTDKTTTAQTNKPASHFENPFQAETSSTDLSSELASLQLKIKQLENQLTELANNNEKASSESSTSNKNTRRSRIVSPNKENLVLAGINDDTADEILRRISQQDYRRLELQNLMQRSDSSNRRQYTQELRELNKNRISLRTELGDEAFDQYLYVSGQNNRVKVTSVMAGSPAELADFKKDDVILYYDNQKILSWTDIRKATIQGEIGSYTSVEILRDGNRMSLMVPRGTLGVQLDALQLDPAE